MINNSDGTISLLSKGNGQYVCADDGGSSNLIANRGGIGLWEKFNFINLDEDGNTGNNCSTAACIIGGMNDDWKLNAFSGSLYIGSGSFGEDGSNGLDYEDRASTSDNSNWFYDQSGYAVFKCHVGNPSSNGSGNMRSELRELDGNGNEIEWDGTNGTLHKMTYKVQVRQLPSSGKVCFGQIHGEGDFDDVIKYCSTNL